MTPIYVTEQAGLQQPTCEPKKGWGEGGDWIVLHLTCPERHSVVRLVAGLRPAHAVDGQHAEAVGAERREVLNLRRILSPLCYSLLTRFGADSRGSPGRRSRFPLFGRIFLAIFPSPPPSSG